MKILKQKDLKRFREKHHPDIDPISNQVIVNPTLDHCHATGYCRGVLDSSTNCFLGKVENAFKRYIKYQGEDLRSVLPRLVEYIENYPLRSLEVIHPKSVQLNIRKFGRLKAIHQERVLKIINVPNAEISNCKTKAERVKLYKKYFLHDKNIYKF